MVDSTQLEAVERLTPLQVITLCLSVYVLLALFIQSAFPLAAATNELLDKVDFFVCIVFLTDFSVRLARARSKSAFLKWGWIDLISSIPVLPIFRVGRLVRIIRILRILRAFRSTKSLLTYLLRNRKTTSLAAVASISFILMIFSAVAMLQFETEGDSNIRTPIDALWWSFVTITTVGYGDKFPVTVEGRIVACFLMLAGVGLFGTFTGFIASLFVEPEMREDDRDIQQLVREIQDLRTELSSLRSQIIAPRPEQFPSSTRGPSS
jgi:voltage-gated potassium channel